MKKVFFVIWLLAVFNFSQTPEVDIPLEVNDGAGGSAILYFGLDPIATDEMDWSLGELPLPPLPPQTIFDARFNLPNGMESSLKDYRQGTNTFSGVKEYRIQYQPGAGSVINIIWNLVPGVTGLLQDLFGGVVVNVSMSGSGSYQVTNPGALDKLKMTITYASPSLISPPSGAENIPILPTLSWNSLTGAINYGLYIATDDGFNNPVYTDTLIVDTSKTLTSALNPNTVYYWKVRGINANGGLLYSATRSFRTIRTIGWANLQYSGNQTITQGENITAYGRVYIEGVTPGAGGGTGISAWIGYSSQNSNPETWTNWVSAVYNQDYGNNDEYQASFGETLAMGEYYFASRYQYNNGPYAYGGYSASGGGFWDGIVNVSGRLTVLSELPGVPSLISPEDNAVSVSILPTFTWGTPINATVYRLQIAKDSGFGNLIVNDSTITDTSETITTSLEELTKYYWRVSAKNISGTSAFSNTRSFTTRDTTTNLEEEPGISDFVLYQNHPNPFNPVTSIKYRIPIRSHVTLKVFAITGNELAVLVNREQDAGFYEVNFNGANNPSGVYFYEINTGKYRSYRKMILLK